MWNWKSIAPARAGIDRPRLQEAGLAPTLSEVAEGDLVEAERLLAASADATRPERRVPKMTMKGLLASSGEVTPALHLALQIGAAPEARQSRVCTADMNDSAKTC